MCLCVCSAGGSEAGAPADEKDNGAQPKPAAEESDPVAELPKPKLTREHLLLWKPLPMSRKLAMLFPSRAKTSGSGAFFNPLCWDLLSHAQDASKVCAQVALVFQSCAGTVEVVQDAALHLRKPVDLRQHGGFCRGEHQAESGAAQHHARAAAGAGGGRHGGGDGVPRGAPRRGRQAAGRLVAQPQAASWRLQEARQRPPHRRRRPLQRQGLRRVGWHGGAAWVGKRCNPVEQTEQPEARKPDPTASMCEGVVYTAGGRGRGSLVLFIVAVGGSGVKQYIANMQ